MLGINISYPYPTPVAVAVPVAVVPVAVAVVPNPDPVVALVNAVGSLAIATSTAMRNYKKNLQSASSLNQRSIVQFSLEPENLKLQYSADPAATNALKQHTIEIEVQKNMDSQTIEKKATAYSRFSKLFDFAAYALVPIAILSVLTVAIALILTTSMTIIGPILIATGALLSALLIFQAITLGLLIREHKKIDADMQQFIQKELNRLEVVNQNITINMFNDCNIINLVIAVRDINLARIQESINEYNSSLENDSLHTRSINLINSELVNNIIIMLGSLFINESNESARYNFKNYAEATKHGIISLIESKDIDIIKSLVGCLSRNHIPEKYKNYSLLKHAIIAKLNGITTIDSKHFASNYFDN